MKSHLGGLLSVVAAGFLLQSCGPKWTSEDKGTFTVIHNQDGQALGYSPASGLNILTVSRYAFKDLNRNGSLDPYEDWRLTADERAADLASKLSVDEIAGLMLYSSHQAIPARGGSFGGGTYNGKPFAEGGASPGALSDQQIKFLTEDNVRHVLITTVQSPAAAAEWNNNAQRLAEGTGFGIPVNTSSDPRHGSDINAEYNAGAGGKISMWPSTLGLAASFEPLLMHQFGEIASQEYRALGIATALSPQIDLATEPRWSRFDGTMGEDPLLASDMARAYVDGFQTSDGEFEISGGWGFHSVNAMVKHWPGGGPEEGGRDGHFGYGAYAIYPGNNLKDHLKPFVDGAFKLSGPTGSASAVMPYYTISFDQDTVYGENVGNSYSKYIISDLLRSVYGFNGVVCTDWGITADVPSIYAFAGKCWGTEKMTVDERHYKAIIAGVDQFGGNNDKGPVIAAYNMGVKEYGEEFMRKRFEQSAVRLLRNIFRVGLFENPYLEISEAERIVGNPDFMKAGYEAQLRSVVMLKNHNKTLPLQKEIKVYIPKRHVPGGTNWFGQMTPESWIDAVNKDVASRYFLLVSTPQQADAAIVTVDSPDGGSGFSTEDLKENGNGYVPITLQYGPYKAEYAREMSIAGGSPFEAFKNRTFMGKTVTARNSEDMKMVKETKAIMGNKPVIVLVRVSKPMVFSDIEGSADAILVNFGVQTQALLDIIAGVSEPSALLPFQMPADMKTVEEQLEDTPRDMECYTDCDGNTYDFAFGLNWSGVIKDARVSRYK
jgi:beta-glucosidase